jgi:uncharacterized membrane protein
MWGGAYSFAIAAGAFVFGLIAFAFVIGAPILAIPIVLAAVALIGLIDFRRRRSQAKQMGEFREQAKTEKVEFTARDRETLVSE